MKVCHCLLCEHRAFVATSCIPEARRSNGEARGERVFGGVIVDLKPSLNRHFPSSTSKLERYELADNFTCYCTQTLILSTAPSTTIMEVLAAGLLHGRFLISQDIYLFVDGQVFLDSSQIVFQPQDLITHCEVLWETSFNPPIDWLIQRWPLVLATEAANLGWCELRKLCLYLYSIFFSQILLARCYYCFVYNVCLRSQLGL